MAKQDLSITWKEVVNKQAKKSLENNNVSGTEASPSQMKNNVSAIEASPSQKNNLSGTETSPSQKRSRVSRTVENNNVRPSKKQVEEDPRSCSSGKFSKKGSSEDRSITVRLSDPDVLDCPICFDSLTIPIYRCLDGRVTCSKCYNNNLRKECATCSFLIIYRCIALEKVLESVKIPCPYAEYGCMEESLSCSEKNNHKLDCSYVPCSCPYSGCDVVASSKDLSLHFKNKHYPGLSFMYDHRFSVTLDFDSEQAPINIIQESTDGNLFILHNDAVTGVGNAISVSCIGPNSNHRYKYEIRAESEGYFLRFKSFTKNIQGLDGTRSSRFLLVPSDYFGASKTGQLEIIIWSNDEKEN